MQPRPWPDVPELTAKVARSSFPKGNLAMRIREELGEVYADTRFAAAFGVRGRPGISPGQLMMASVLQFTENLTDRQAAERGPRPGVVEVRAGPGAGGSRALMPAC